MTGLRYSPLHVTELCEEMQGNFKVGCARLKSKTNDGDRSRSIRRNRKSFHVTKKYNAYNDVLLGRNHRLLM